MEYIYTDDRDRCIKIAEYIIESGSTVRKAAKVFGISKSTVHKDVTVNLEKRNPTLANETKKILQKNKNERHIRGGEATRKKYQNLKDHDIKTSAKKEKNQ